MSEESTEGPFRFVRAYMGSGLTFEVHEGERFLGYAKQTNSISNWYPVFSWGDRRRTVWQGEDCDGKTACALQLQARLALPPPEGLVPEDTQLQLSHETMQRLRQIVTKLDAFSLTRKEAAELTQILSL